MTVHLIKSADRLVLLARAEGVDIVGDASFEVVPGGSALGRSYAEWAALPDGPHEIRPRVEVSGHPAIIERTNP